MKPIHVALTQGDPAGIGPELCLTALASPALRKHCRLVVVGDYAVLSAVSKKLGVPLACQVLSEREFRSGSLTAIRGDQPMLVDCEMIRGEMHPGLPTAEAGAASYRYLEVAIEGALAGRLDAVTTAPITKLTLAMAGIHDPGHTEIFGRLTGAENFAMMLYSPRLAVSFVTCHQSLASVPQALTVEGIRRVAGLTGATLLKIRGAAPRLAILGLNPHAGEGGLFGLEDRDLVVPAVELARQDGWDVTGPLSPDAAFMPSALKKYDGHVTLYHDQGSIPFKMISLHDGVNITMGLPIIRTSVDHGTAYDIAWQGRADASSLEHAILLAAQLACASRPLENGQSASLVHLLEGQDT